jgi:hypothetical protein
MGSLQNILFLNTGNLVVNKLHRSHILRLIFESATICLMMKLERYSSKLWTDTAVFIESYKDYESFKVTLTDEEIQKCLKFRNVMSIALQLIPPKLEHLLDLVTKTCEGLGVTYTNGSGRTKATSRRIDIFRHEADKKQCKRPVQPSRKPQGSKKRKQLEESSLINSNDDDVTIISSLSSSSNEKINECVPISTTSFILSPDSDSSASEDELEVAALLSNNDPIITLDQQTKLKKIRTLPPVSLQSNNTTESNVNWQSISSSTDEIQKVY